MAYSEEKTLRDEAVTYHFDDVKAHPATYFNSDSYLSDSEEEKQEGQKEQEESRTTKIVRVVVIAFILIVIILSSTRLIFHLVRPERPSVQLNSFNLSNFNVSETRLSTDWNANITVMNPDFKFSFIFSKTSGSIWYGGKILSEVDADDRDHKFGRKEKGAISFKQTNATLVEVSQLEEKDSDGKKLDEGVVSFIKKKGDSVRRELKDIKDHSVKGGSLTMEFGLAVDNIAMADSWWERKVILVFSCGNLTMRFVSDTEAAAVLGNHGRTCFITSYN